MSETQHSDPARNELPPTSQTTGKMVPPGGMAGDQLVTNRPPDLHPGDALPADAPSAGETVCFECNGTGRRDKEPCAACGGTGKVIEAVSGGP